MRPVIYFIRPVDLAVQRVKIGLTAGEPKKRLAALNTGSPHRLELLSYIRMHQKYECGLHRLFEPVWAHGEWFTPIGKLGRILNEMERQHGSGGEWSDLDFWAVVFRTLLDDQDLETAKPRELAMFDKRILGLFSDDRFTT